MEPLCLHELHCRLSAQFTELNGMEVVAHYGDRLAEHAALRESAGVLDLSFRSRLCLTGGDRARFLHGQVTNDVKRLQVGGGCYAALITAKGRMQSDLNIYCLKEELLLDFEPGLTETVSQRLEKYIIADDVQVLNIARQYGLLSVQGPKAEALIHATKLFQDVPAKPFAWTAHVSPELGEIYLVNQPRLSTAGFDLFIPSPGLASAAETLLRAAAEFGGRPCGWDAFEIARIEAGLPRFGADMDETNIPLEAGVEDRAVSFDKGCYIGQEVLSRIRTYGHVTKHLRGLLLGDGMARLPESRDKLFHSGKEAGYVTSAVSSPAFGANIALGYVRRDIDQPGTELTWRGQNAEGSATIVGVPFKIAGLKK
jgi:folate-binding protein YgfZ